MQSDSNWSNSERLDLFVSRSGDIINRRVVRSKSLEVNLHLSFDRAIGMRLDSREPDEEDLRSFLMDFRMFISEKEPVFIPRVRSLIIQGLDASSPLRTALINSKKAWHQQLRTGILRVNLNGKQYSPEDVLDLWINGYYFHNDKDKRIVLESLLGPGQVLARQGLLNVTLDGLYYIAYLRNVILTARSQGLIHL